MLPPTSFFGIWHLYVLPILGAVVLAIVNRMRGKYDFILLLTFEVLLLAWFVVPDIIRDGGFRFYPFEIPLWFACLVVSLPAIGAFILSGIAYLLTRPAAKNKSV